MDTWIWFRTAGVDLDVALGGHPQDVPLHVDVVLSQVDTLTTQRCQRLEDWGLL